TPRTLASSRTERSLGDTAICGWADCNPGVTRGLSKPPKSGETSPFDVAPVPVVPEGCEELPLPATTRSLPVTPGRLVRPASVIAVYRVAGIRQVCQTHPLSSAQSF